jgi:hypothetical protein
MCVPVAAKVYAVNVASVPATARIPVVADFPAVASIALVTSAPVIAGILADVPDVAGIPACC